MKTETLGKQVECHFSTSTFLGVNLPAGLSQKASRFCVMLGRWANNWAMHRFPPAAWHGLPKLSIKLSPKAPQFLLYL